VTYEASVATTDQIQIYDTSKCLRLALTSRYIHYECLSVHNIFFGSKSETVLSYFCAVVLGQYRKSKQRAAPNDQWAEDEK
jgi:hypothetical protein